MRSQLLVELAGLNPMGSNPYRAGLPEMNLHAALRDLTSAGFSVAVGEQSAAPRGGTRSGANAPRFLGGLVVRVFTRRRAALPIVLSFRTALSYWSRAAQTPSSPVYVHNAASCDSQPWGAAPPVIGVAHASTGFVVVEACPDARTLRVSERLPEHAALCRMHAAGESAPLYAHASLDALPGAAAAGAAAGAAVWAALRARSRPAVRFGSHRGDPSIELEDVVLRDLLPGTERRSPPFDRAPGCRPDDPLPLFASTAEALGVTFTPGVPDLVDSLLPPTSPPAVKHAVRSLLLCPPPESAARGLAAALAALASSHAPLPRPPLVSPAQVCRLLRDREASAAFLADVSRVAGAAARMLSSPVLSAVATPLLPLAARTAGVGVDVDQLVGDCEAAEAAIDAILAEAGRGGGADGGDDDGGVQRGKAAAGADARSTKSRLGSRLGEARAGESGTPGEAPWRCGDAPPVLRVLPDAARRDMEAPWRGRVRASLPQVAPAYAAVNAAASELDAALADDLVHPPACAGGALVWDGDDCSVWLRSPKKGGGGGGAAAHSHPSLLRLPVDRNGKGVAGCVTTPRVEAACGAYRSACDSAQSAVLKLLRDTAASLAPSIPSLATAAALGLWARAAADHAREAARRGWCLPVLGPSNSAMAFTDLTPFWMDRGPGGAAGHDGSLDGVWCAL